MILGWAQTQPSGRVVTHLHGVPGCSSCLALVLCPPRLAALGARSLLALRHSFRPVAAAARRRHTAAARVALARRRHAAAHGRGRLREDKIITNNLIGDYYDARYNKRNQVVPLIVRPLAA